MIAAARATFSRALALDRNSVTDLAGLVNLRLATGKRAEAQAPIAGRLVKDQENPAVLELAGRMYMIVCDAKRAEETWRKLIEIQPANMTPYSALGQVYIAPGRLEEAGREFPRILQRQPKGLGRNTLIGILLERQNRFPEAQKQYERMIQINPNAAVAANNLGWSAAKQDANLDVALRSAQRAKSQLPSSPQVDDTLGRVYYKKGLYSLAVTSLRNSLAKDPANPAYLYLLGLAQMKNGGKTKARELLERALNANRPFLRQLTLGRRLRTSGRPPAG
jgi:tetratricopeptide (TPR) repeat protein